MKYTRILLVALVVILLIIFGCTQNSQSTTSPQQQEKFETVFEQTTCGDECILEKARNESNSSLCELILSENVLQECYTHFAYGDLGICRKVSDESIRDDCLFEHAKQQDDPFLCDEIVSLNEECVDYFGEEACEGDTLCFALYYKDPSYCDDDECIFNYVIETGDSNVCNLLDLKAEQYACQALTEDYRTCGEAEDVVDDYCYWLYAYYKNESSYCYFADLETSYRTDCLKHFAVLENDYTLCKGVYVQDQSKCYENYSLTTGNLSGCLAISKYASSTRFSCYYDFAYAFQEPYVCDYVREYMYYDDCMGRIVYDPERDVTTELCEKMIDDESWYAACSRELEKQNTSVTS